MMTLDQMRIGQKAFVREIRFAGTTKRRLLDLGLIRGTEICALQRSPSGDPVAYCFRGAVVALRKADAEQIEIDPI